MTDALFQSRPAALVLLLSSIGALGFAFTAQYAFDLQPCVLCLYQRWPYGIAIVLALAALALRGQQRALILVFVSLALVFLANAAIAAFHVGVEQQWWQGTSECTAEVGTASSLADLKAQILAAPIVRCDEVAWSLFGISMAGYNVLASAGLFVFALLAARRA